LPAAAAGAVLLKMVPLVVQAEGLPEEPASHLAEEPEVPEGLKVQAVQEAPERMEAHPARMESQAPEEPAAARGYFTAVAAEAEATTAAGAAGAAATPMTRA
jgi:hypothetical protein